MVNWLLAGKEEIKKQKEQKERYEKLHKVLTGQY